MNINPVTKLTETLSTKSVEADVDGISVRVTDYLNAEGDLNFTDLSIHAEGADSRLRVKAGALNPETTVVIDIGQLFTAFMTRNQARDLAAGLAALGF